MDKSDKKLAKTRKSQNHEHETTPNLKISRLKSKIKGNYQNFQSRCQVCLAKFIPSRKNSDLKGKLKITCTKCEMEVHLGCYGLTTSYQTIKGEIEDKNEFLCDICSLKQDSSKLECVVCGNSNTYCKAFKKVGWRKDSVKYVHVLCGFFASNIRVTNWRNLGMELIPSEHHSNETKTKCDICLKLSLKSDVWKCSCCDRKAHYICMLIDRIFYEGHDDAKTWVVSLTISPKYCRILELDNVFKGETLKNLKGYANNKVFQNLNSSGEKYDKAFIENFFDSEMESLKEDLADLTVAKHKFGEYRENSNIFYIVFCPEHYHPVCCFINYEESKEMVCCDYCDTWSHQSCLKSTLSEEEVMTTEPFYCENCEEWFKKRAQLEDICDVKTKFEYNSPRKLNSHSSLSHNRELKLEEHESKSNSLLIKKEEATSPKKPSLANSQKNKEEPANELSPPSAEIKLKEEFENSSFDIDLLNRLPMSESRLPVEDFIQLMFFFDVMVDAILKNHEVLERKEVVTMLRLLSFLPFKNYKLLSRVLIHSLNENFLEKEILNKLVTKIASIYSENDSIIRENLDYNKARLEELKTLLNCSKLDVINHEESDSLEDENEVVIQEKNQINLPKERKFRIQALKDMTEHLIIAQTMLINFHFTFKKINANELREFFARGSNFSTLDTMMEIQILRKSFLDFELVCQEINQKIIRKNELLVMEKEDYRQFLKNNRDFTSETFLKINIERRKSLLMEAFHESQVLNIFEQLNKICVDGSKTSSFLLLDSQLKQLKLISDTFLSVPLKTFSPDSLDKIFRDSIGFIVANDELQLFYEIYMNYKLWQGKLNVFQALRRSYKISNYIFQEKLKRISVPSGGNISIFSYLSNNIVIENNPRICYNGTYYNIFEVLSMEHLGTLIKEGKQLVAVNLSETIFQLDDLLKKSYLFQQSLKYIHENGEPKMINEAITPLEIEFFLEEILGQLDEYNLFFPIYHSFEMQRRKFAAIRTFYGIAPEFKFATFPYSSFEEDFYSKYKDKVLHEVYKFLKEKKITKENLQEFSEYFDFFRKSQLHDKYPNEFKVLKDLKQHYLFLATFFSFSLQLRHYISPLKNMNNSSIELNLQPIEAMGININSMELKVLSAETMARNYQECNSFDEIIQECECFLEKLLKDFSNEEFNIQFDWEKESFFEKDTIFYEEKHFPRLVSKYKLFLWLKQIHHFFSENLKDYSKFHFLQTSLQELIIKFGLEQQLQQKHVLYDQFIEFSFQVNSIIQEVNKKIQERLKAKEKITDMELPLVEQDLKILREKIAKLGLVYPMTNKLVTDFENCCIASKKAATLHRMIMVENKKIDYNAMKILIDFAKNFELCELFPSFTDLRMVFDYYESLISKVMVLKDDFAAKKQILQTYKATNIKFHQERFIYSERVTYTRNIYTAIEKLITYDQAKQLIEELNRMKINVKVQRDYLIRYKNKTEVFAKNCEKLFTERKLANLSESNMMDYLSAMVLARNDLINSDILSGLFVNDFRCYEWNLNVLMIQKGYLVFAAEYTPMLGSFEKFSRRFNNKKCPLYRQVLNSESLFRELYHEGRSMSKLFEKSRFYNHGLLLEEMNVTIQKIEQLKLQATALKLRMNQAEMEEEEMIYSLKIDKSFKTSLKTQRSLLLKLNDIDQFIQEIIETRVCLEEEYAIFSSLRSKGLDIIKDLKNIRIMLCSREKIEDAEIEEIVSKIVSLPINLEEDEDFALLLFSINQYFLEKFRDFTSKARTSEERNDFLKTFHSQNQKFLVLNKEVNIIFNVIAIFKGLEGFFKKQPESPEGFSKIFEKSLKQLQKLKKECANDFSPNEIYLLIYGVLVILLKSCIQALEQEKILKYSSLHLFIQELHEFNEKFPNEIRLQKDFSEFCDLYYKVQLTFREIGLEMKKKAYGIKNHSISNNLNIKQEEKSFKGVDLIEELNKVLVLNEEEFIAYFEPLDNIIEVKKMDPSPNTIKIEIEEENRSTNNNIDNNSKSNKSQEIRKSIEKKEENEEEFDSLWEEFSKFIPKENLQNSQSQKEANELENRGDDDEMDIESQDEDDEDEDEDEEDFEEEEEEDDDDDEAEEGDDE